MSWYVILIHGFKDRSAGADNVDLIAPDLEAAGHVVEKDETVDYGWVGLLGVRLFRYKAVARIVNALQAAAASDRPLCAVAYSNGGNYLFKALALLTGARVRVVLIHPALDTRAKIPAAVERGWVVITRSDWAVRLSVLVRWLIPTWGAMGVAGYRGDDPRLQNTIDLSDVARGHGGAFKPHSRQILVREILRILAQPLEDASK
jgi:hypothetical protein